MSLSILSCTSMPPPGSIANAAGARRGSAEAVGVGRNSSGLLDLMPYPASLTRTGGTLLLRDLPVIVENGAPAARGGGPPSSRRVAYALSLLRARLVALTGRHGTGSARLVLDWHRTARLSLDERESYRLVVSAKSIEISAPTDLGVLHGIATLAQLLVPEPGGGASLPQVVIQDHPRFRWRGLLLDCVRHFMPVAAIKRTLLGMAAVKLNVFHWHLSDDQGFRIQSRLFPRLTGVASNGEYYTQRQVREIVRYANQLGIRVVPEFDMPAHTSAALAAYPSLGAGSGPFRVQTTFGGFDDVMDPSRAATYRAIKRFLGEMVTLFPDRYLHIGGDENNFKEWAQNAHIAAFMRARRMTTFPEVSYYFTRRVEEILRSLHRRAIVWEESWNGRRDPGSVVQVWLRAALVRKAVAVGQPVIRSAGYYLDLLYPASAYYEVDPADGTGNNQDVLGGEAAMWAELVSPANLDSRLWPRLAAIAERFWSPASLRSVPAMYARLPSIDDYLASIGMRQFADERRMLARLAGGQVSPALDTLASVLEPLRGYRRISTEHYTTTTPLDRMVDAIPPESLAALRFSNLVRSIAEGVPRSAGRSPGTDGRAARVPPAPNVASRVHRADLQEARNLLERWRHNDSLLRPLLAERQELHELLGVSSDLSLVAAAGIAAVDRLARYPAGVRPADDPEWLARELTILRRLPGWNRAQVTIAVVAPVRTLIYAACGLQPPPRG